MLPVCIIVLFVVTYFVSGSFLVSIPSINFECLLNIFLIFISFCCLLQSPNNIFTYKLYDQYNAFNLNATTGELTVRNSSILDRETHEMMKVKVRTNNCN